MTKYRLARIISAYLIPMFIIGIFIMSPASAMLNNTTDLTSDPPGSALISPLLDISDSYIREPFKETIYNTSDPGVSEPLMNENWDIANFLPDNKMEYQNVWEPWLTKAAVRCIAQDPNQQWLAVGGGYLYDNEIHIFRWNEYSREYDKVWDSGDMIIQGDVISIDFGDTDNNDFLEVVAGSADGHVYVFEQEHIYDPYDNMENQFAHVWTSPKIEQVWGVKISDVDKDYIPDIVAGSWDGKIHIYEYTNHSGYPFSKDHWIEYTEKTTIDVGEKIYSIETADTNYNALPEIIAGTQNGRVYIYENNGTVLWVNGKPWPLTNDNSYRYHWDSGNLTWNPITKIVTGNLDTDSHEEIAYISQGQGTFTIDFDPDLDMYLTHQLWFPLEDWETPDAWHYLNHYIDAMTWSNNNDTGNNEAHVFYDNTTYFTLEPWNKSNPDVLYSPSYPKDTVAGLEPDYEYVTFDPLETNASAILDFGNDGEVMGDGLVAIPEYGLGYDVIATISGFTYPHLGNLIIELSPDGENWVTVTADDMVVSKKFLMIGAPYEIKIDVDPILSRTHLSYFRYLKLTVFDQILKLDAIYAPTLYRPMDTASAITIGHLDEIYDLTLGRNTGEAEKIVLGTVDGKLIAFEYNPVTKAHEWFWNSYTNDSYTQGTQIWALLEVQSAGKIPTWLYREKKSPIIDLFGPEGLNNPATPHLAQVSGVDPHPVQDDGLFASMDTVPLMSTFFGAIFENIGLFNDTGIEGYDQIISLNIPPNDLVIGTDNGKLVMFPELTSTRSPLSNYFFYDINYGAYAYYAFKEISPHFADLVHQPSLSGFPETLFVGVIDPETKYSADKIAPADAEIFVYTYGVHPVSPIGSYTTPYILREKEITGLLSKALEKSMVLPKITSGDMDGDGDQDLVLANGKLYYIENLGNDLWRFDQDYFRDINLVTSKYVFNDPLLSDFDDDGDLDLSVGFANREGATYYENIGTSSNPEWKQDKWLYTNSNGGLWYFDLMYPTFYKDATHITGLTTYLNETEFPKIVRLKADYDYHNSYVIGTNPIIARLEINLRSGYDTENGNIANYGYHIFETWNTESDLAQWTQKITVGDTDQDGRGEVIIGDFDNNMYVFEHLTNNTYKRSYRSQDLTHSEYSTVSPYAYEQLEGISGTFYRTIWDHVDELTAGTDLDGDGYLEIIATAGLSIFVWEQHQEYYLGIDDEYDLVWWADLSNSPWKPAFDELEIDHFTALAAAGDLDYNGFGEFVVAAKSFLFIFESNGYDGFTDNFLLNPFPARGHYQLPGNPYANRNVRQLSIESIVIADTDKDRLNDIVLGGVNNTWYGQYNGFVIVLENQIGTYDYTWCAPSKYMEDNPVYDLAVDDQDLDGYPEIIAGTFKGVVIYENYHLYDDDYRFKGVLTSYVNFPYMHLEQLFNEYIKGVETLYYNDLVELVTPVGDYGEGTWIQVFSMVSQLFYCISTDYGVTWSSPQLVIDVDKGNDKIIYYTGTTWYLVNGQNNGQPSIIQASDGRVYLTFTGGITFRNSQMTYRTEEGIWLLEFVKDGSDHLWTNQNLQVGDSKKIVTDSFGPEGYTYQHPSLFEFPNNTDTKVAISYINKNTGKIYWKDASRIEASGHSGSVPDIGNDPSTDKYSAIYQDAIRMANGEYAIFFTGMLYKEAKLDYDVWIAKANSSLIFEETYSRVTIDSTDDVLPSVTQTIDTDTLMVIFKAEGLGPSGILMVTYSKDNGTTWRDPEPVTIIPPFAEYRPFPTLGFSLLVLKDDPNILVSSLLIGIPSITRHYTGGFAYSFVAEFYFSEIAILGSTTTFDVTHHTGYLSQMGASESSEQDSSSTTSHTGMIRQIGGQLTSSGGYLTYQTENIGLLSNFSVSGGGSAIYYTAAAAPQVISLPAVQASSGITYTGNIMAFDSDISGNDDGYDEGSGSGGSGGGAAGLVAAFDVGSSSFPTDSKPRDHGLHKNIFYGLNPTSDFTYMDFMEAKAIDVGDSDQDFRREIAVASGDKAYVAELAHSSKFKNFYTQPWHSDSLATETTDIAIYDANGNGWGEIIVSCTEGNVYSFEGLNLNLPVTDYQGLEAYEGPVWVNSEINSNATKIYDSIMALTDIEGDNIDEIFVSNFDPSSNSITLVVRLLSGIDGSTIWTWTYDEATAEVVAMKSGDLNNDSINDVVFVVKTGDKYLVFALDGTTGTTLSNWSSNPVIISEGDATVVFRDLVLGDLNNDSCADILAATNLDVFRINGNNGAQEISLIHFGTGTTWILDQVDIRNADVLVSMHDLTVVNTSLLNYYEDPGLAGLPSPTYSIEYNDTTESLIASALVDLNEGVSSDFVAFVNRTIFSYDGATGEILWNTTLNERILTNHMLVNDLTGDNVSDIIVQTNATGHVGFTKKTVTFDEFANMEWISTNDSFYPDLIFAPNNWRAWAFGTAIYPVKSAPNNIYAANEDNYIIIKGGASKVAAYISAADYDFAGTFLMQGYDETGKLVAETYFLENSVHQYIELIASSGLIYKVVFTGTNGYDGSFTIDDLSYWHANFGSHLRAFDGLNGKEIWSYTLYHTYAQIFSLGDLDSDGEKDDILFATDSNEVSYKHDTCGFYTLDGTDGSPIWFAHAQIEPEFFAGLIAGNFSNVNAGEAILFHWNDDVDHLTFNCYAAVQYKPTPLYNLSIVWPAKPGFKSRGPITDIVVFDLNGNGYDDVVFSDGKNYIIAMEGGGRQSILWKARLSSPAQAIAASDVTGDSIPDIVAITRNGLITVISGETGLVVWRDYFGFYFINQMEFYDLNGDGKVTELIIAAGAMYSSTVGYLFVIDGTNGDKIFTKKFWWAAPVTKFYITDVNLDDDVEIVFASYEKFIRVINGQDGSNIDHISVKVHDFAVGLFTANTYPGIVIMLRNGSVMLRETDDGWLTHKATPTWHNMDINPRFRLSHLTTVHLNDDAMLDVVVRSFGEAHYGFSGKDGHLMWTFDDPSIFYHEQYLVADINNDGLEDIIALNHDIIFAIDGNDTFEIGMQKYSEKRVTWASFIADDTIVSMKLGQFDKDGIPDVVFGTVNGYIYIVHGKPLETKIQVSPKVSSFDDSDGLLSDNSRETIATLRVSSTPPTFSPGKWFLLIQVIISWFLLLFSTNIFYRKVIA